LSKRSSYKKLLNDILKFQVQSIIEGCDVYIKREVMLSLKETSKTSCILARGLVHAVFEPSYLLKCTASGIRTGQKDQTHPMEGLHPPAMVAILGMLNLYTVLYYPQLITASFLSVIMLTRA
jgi:hypothetical protein